MFSQVKFYKALLLVFLNIFQIFIMVIGMYCLLCINGLNQKNIFRVNLINVEIRKYTKPHSLIKLVPTDRNKGLFYVVVFSWLIKSNSMSIEHHSGSHWNDINGWLFLATPSVASSRSTLKSSTHIRTHRITSNYLFTRGKCVLFHFALLLYYTVWQISTSSQRTMILPRRLNVAVPSI